MTWQTFLFIAVAGFAFFNSGKKLWMLTSLMKAQKGKGPEIKEIPARIIDTFVNVLGQKAVLQKKIPGIMHTIIFWGFLIITIGTIEQFLGTLYNKITFEFLGEKIYPALLFTQDLFTGLILLAVGFAFYRRLVMKPKGLTNSSDAFFVLTFTASLMVAILMMNAFHILGDTPWYADSFIFSKQIAKLFVVFNFSADLNHLLFTSFKWIHMLLVLGFAMYIPGSKHLHVLAAGPNTFLRKLNRPKGMKPIDFTDESLTQYGAAKINDLSWKDTLDYYSCTECGRCQDLCPAWNTDKPLSPKKLVTDLKYNLFRNKDLILAGKNEEVSSIVDEAVTSDVLWACTSCRACEVACPVFIEHTDKIYEARRNLVMMESQFPAEVQSVFKNLETNASPWAFSAADRANWAEGLEVKTMAEDSSADILLWVGCAGSFDDRNKKVLKSFVNILKKAEIKFSILGTEEQCTGDAARRIGNEYLFQTLATANIETMNRYGVKKVVTACPHCFNTLKNEYKDFGGHYEVYHHSEFISSLIKEGKIKPSKKQNETITFHDSCYLGRWNNIYSEPREVLESSSITPLKEMKQNHDQSMCCGAGGGRMWMEETIGKRINVTRTEQAIDTGATIIASSCPFCMTMLSDGIKTKEKTETMKVLDIAEVVEQSLMS